MKINRIMHKKYYHSICTLFTIIILCVCCVNVTFQDKYEKDDDYIKIEIGKGLFDMELFSDEELVSLTDKGNFNAIDHFVQYETKNGQDQLIGFEDDFIQNNQEYIHEYEFYQDKAVTEQMNRPARNNYDDEYKDPNNNAFKSDNITYEYDYDKFKNEYYNIKPMEPPNIPNDTKSSNFSQHDQLLTKNDIFEKEKDESLDCTKVGTNNRGWKGIKCTWYDIKQSNNSIDYQNAGIRLGGVVWFWFKIYVIIAVCLWAVKGWSCCCCTCKICKTRELVEDIKYYIIQNPPGIIRLPDDSVCTYKPTKKELETYKQLEEEIYFQV